jgi:hypothetical protein
MRRQSTILIVVGLLVAVALAGLWWRATWVANHLLHSEAPKSIADKSGGVYRLAVGRVRFNPFARRIKVDSIHLTTDEAANARRPQPRAVLRLALQSCTLRGIHLVKLVAGRGLTADSFGCPVATASADVSLAHGTAAGSGGAATVAAGQAFYVLQRGLRLPAFAPNIAVQRIEFPNVELDLRLRPAGRGQRTSRLRLGRLQWRMADFAVDPTDSAATSRPLFSRTVEIAGEHFVWALDSTPVIRVARFAASLPDSTIEIHGIAFAPAVSIDRIALRGFDAGEFILGNGLRARRVQVDSLHIDVLSDRRQPSKTLAKHHRNPQQWIADLDRSIAVESLLVRGGEVLYREHRPRRPDPGVMTFARLDAVAVHVRHLAGRRTGARGGGDPMTLHATAYLQDSGRLDTRFVVPLDAPRFDMMFAGTLSTMPADKLNAFIEQTLAVRVDKGLINEITFDASVVDGVARGTITPRYKDFALAVTGRGAKGILGTGGAVGDAARGVATLVENETALRSDNPDEGQTTPRRGTINHAFNPAETLPGFLWFSLRDGLFAVVRK